MTMMKFLNTFDQPKTEVCQTIVCLHASTSTARQWQPLRAALQNKNYTIIAPDLYGYGQGPTPTDTFSMVDEIELVLSLLDEDACFHLVGHSYGGGVALRVAKQVPERVLSLTLFEPAALGYLKPHDYTAYMEAETALGAMERLVDEGELVQAASRFVNYWVGQGAFEQMPAYMQKIITSSMPKVRLEREGVFTDCVDVTRLSTLTMPIRVLSGTHSTMAAQALARLLHQTFPSSHWTELEGLGHMAPVTHATAVNKHIIAFLDSVVETNHQRALSSAWACP